MQLIYGDKLKKSLLFDKFQVSIEYKWETL